MPTRIVRGEILSSRSLSRVSLAAESMFWRMLIAADDYGRLDGRLGVLRSALWPARDEPPDAQQVEKCLMELEASDPSESKPSGCILRYEVGGAPFILLTGWERWRGAARRAAVSKFPAPPGVVDAEVEAVVYFVQDGERGDIRIGWTAILEERLEQLRVSMPNLRLLGTVVSDTRALEKKLLRRFEGLRAIDSDGFRPDPELLAWIESNAERPAASRAHRGPSRPVPHPSYRLASDEGRWTRDEGRGTNSADPADPQSRSVKMAWTALCEAAAVYKPSAARWSLSEARQRQLRALMREWPDLGPRVGFALAHGYRAARRSWEKVDDYFTPDTLLRAANRGQYVEAFNEAQERGEQPPYRATAKKSRFMSEYDRALEIIGEKKKK